MTWFWRKLKHRFGRCTCVTVSCIIDVDRSNGGWKPTRADRLYCLVCKTYYPA